MPLLDPAGARRPLRAGGHSLLVYLGHGDCGTSALLLPYVERMHRRGGRVAAVLQEDEQGARALAREFGLTLPVWRDEEPYRLAEALGAVGVPALYLLDGESRVQRVSEGFVRDEIEELAAAAAVPPPLFTAADAAPARRPG